VEDGGEDGVEHGAGVGDGVEHELNIVAASVPPRPLNRASCRKLQLTLPDDNKMRKLWKARECMVTRIQGSVCVALSLSF